LVLSFQAMVGELAGDESIGDCWQPHNDFSSTFETQNHMISAWCYNTARYTYKYLHLVIVRIGIGYNKTLSRCDQHSCQALRV
jgi:hypothetical protein